jgi:hypothetical protein
MKRALAVTLLLMSFASVALADGPDLPPANAERLLKPSVVLLADGPDLPPASLHNAVKPEVEV